MGLLPSHGNTTTSDECGLALAVVPVYMTRAQYEADPVTMEITEWKCIQSHKNDLVESWGKACCLFDYPENLAENAPPQRARSALPSILFFCFPENASKDTSEQNNFLYKIQSNLA